MSSLGDLSEIKIDEDVNYLFENNFNFFSEVPEKLDLSNENSNVNYLVHADQIIKDDADDGKMHASNVKVVRKIFKIEKIEEKREETMNLSDQSKGRGELKTTQTEIEVLPRRYSVDCMAKKNITHFFKFLLEENIQPCLKKGTRRRLFKLPQSFIANVTTDFVASYLLKSLRTVYTENEIFTKIEEKTNSPFTDLILPTKLESFNSTMDTHISELYKDYLGSKRFQQDKKAISEKQKNKLYGIKYIDLACRFLTTFSK